jgi:multidrug efflux system outer membrane protein
MTLPRFLLLGLLLGGLALSGCSLTPSMPAPEAEQDLPDRYEAAAGDTTLPAAATDTARYDATRWWTAYDDPALTALVDTALAANLDLSVARARLDELAAQFRIARAPLFPSVTANAQGSYQNQPANTGIGGAIGGGQGPDRFEFTDYQATLGVSYELDFWGRVRSQRKAALNQYFATAADLQTARLSVISQTISTYAQIASSLKTATRGACSRRSSCIPFARACSLPVRSSRTWNGGSTRHRRAWLRSLAASPALSAPSCPIL